MLRNNGLLLLLLLWCSCLQYALKHVASPAVLLLLLLWLLRLLLLLLLLGLLTSCQTS
jgi:hypothetical protein